MLNYSNMPAELMKRLAEAQDSPSVEERNSTALFVIAAALVGIWKELEGIKGALHVWRDVAKERER